MKTLQKLFLLAIASSMLFACKSTKTSKSTYSFGTPYHKFEMNTAVEASVENNPSTELNENLAKSKPSIRIEDLKQGISKLDKSNLSQKEQKLVQKLEKKINKIEKISKNSENKKSSLSKNLKLGIVLAAVGLLLIILGGLGIWLFYVFGAIAFIAGGVLILLELLDM